MKTLQESIIGRKGSTNKTIIHIPGTIEFLYEINKLSSPINGWKATDKCNDWYLLVDQEKLIVALWSPKAKHYPFLYTVEVENGNFNRIWNLVDSRFIIKNFGDINNPNKIYDLITIDIWDNYVEPLSLKNVTIKMPKEIENLIRDRADLHF